MLRRCGLYRGLEGVAGDDDDDEEDEQQGDDGVGNDLKRRAGHGAVLAQLRMLLGVVPRHGAQLLLDVVAARGLHLLLLRGGGNGGLGLPDGSRLRLFGCGLRLDDRLRLLDDGLLGGRFLFHYIG